MAPPITEPPCSIWLDDMLFEDGTMFERVERCTFLVHEYGHNIGLSHSDKPISAMKADMDGIIVRGCWTAFIPKQQRRESLRDMRESGQHFATR